MVQQSPSSKLHTTGYCSVDAPANNRASASWVSKSLGFLCPLTVRE